MFRESYYYVECLRHFLVIIKIIRSDICLLFDLKVICNVKSWSRITRENNNNNVIVIKSGYLYIYVIFFQLCFRHNKWYLTLCQLETVLMDRFARYCFVSSLFPCQLTRHSNNRHFALCYSFKHGCLKVFSWSYKKDK